MRLGYGFDGQCLRQDDAELPLASRSILEQNYRSNAVGNAVIVAAWNAVIERNTLREQKQAVSVLRRRGEPIWIVECQCPGLDGYAVCMLLGTLLKLLCTRLGIRVAYGYTQDHYQ